MQPLTSDAADALRELHSPEAKPHDLVFAGRLPRMPLFREDLKAAGIQYTDGRGETADFHALRKTYGTMLTLAGIGQRTVMELMRTATCGSRQKHTRTQICCRFRMRSPR